MLNLGTTIPMPNINRVDVTKFNDENREDPVDPNCTLTVHFVGVGGRDAGTFSITAYNAANSQKLGLNTAPGGYGDVILRHAATQVDNACTQLCAAYDNAAGNRGAKRVAAYAKAVEIGLIDALLAAS
jgi:hypothetical protein